MFFNKLPVDIQKSMIEKMEGKPSIDIMALGKRFEKIMTGDVTDPMNSPSDMDLIKHACVKRDLEGKPLLDADGKEVFDRGLYDLFRHVFQKGFSEAVFAEDNSEIIKTFTFEGAKTYVSEQTT
jgi:hypothetical protein